MFETKAHIPQPCSQNWETMKIGINSRFCDSCSKNVVDFTAMDRQDILRYLLSNRHKRVCGRIHPSQLDFSHSDFLITIKGFAGEQKITNLSFYLLTVGTMMLISCGSPGETIPVVNNKPSFFALNDTTDVEKPIALPTDTIVKKDSPEKIDITEFVVGEVDMFFDDAAGPYYIVETMPEFNGGIDSLNAFIQKNLQYPEWEKKKNIQGTVYVGFTVSKEGEIKDAHISQSVKGSRNFNKEVIRVINAMPDWIPGKNDGENVDVIFYLPVEFKL